MLERIAIFIWWVQLAVGLESPGIFNRYYQIPYYYGSHFKERSSKENLVNDSPTLLSLSYTYSNDYDSNLWISDKNNHVIKYIDHVIGAVYIVAGVYGTSGYRDGNVVKSMFNKPTSIDVWRSSTHDQIRAKNTKPVLLSQDGASRYECKFATKDNYTDWGGVLITSDLVNNNKLPKRWNILVLQNLIRYAVLLHFTMICLLIVLPLILNLQFNLNKFS